MALTGLVGRLPTPTRIGNANLGEIALDALVQETHEMANRVTEFPVENGAAISDHIANQPRQVSVEGFITSSPVRLAGGILDRLVRVPNFLTGATDSPRGTGMNYAEVAFEWLEKLFQSRELVSIKGKFKTYENMAMVSLSIPRDANTGAAIRFMASFREIVTVTSSPVAVRFPRTSSGKSQPQRDKGKQVPTDTKPPAEKRLISVSEKARQELVR